MEAPASSIGDPFGKSSGFGVVFVPQVRPDASGTTGGSRTGVEARQQRPGTRRLCVSCRGSGAQVLLDVVCSQLVDYDSVDLDWGCKSKRVSFDRNAAQGCCGYVEDTALERHGKR